MPLLIVSIIIEVALVVHIIKTGRNMVWIFLVLFFPLVGSLAYFIVEMLPELMGSRTGLGVRRSIAKSINPHKDLQVATQNYAVADTVQNAMTLANECLSKGHFTEAKELYVRSLNGIHSDDPDLLLGLAKAQFGLGEFEHTVQTLDTLKEKNPEFRSAEGHLLYARALEQRGNTAAAMHEYEALCSYYSGPEPFCRLAQILKANGDEQRANDLFQKVLDESKIAGRHYNAIHKEWILLARREKTASR